MESINNLSLSRLKQFLPQKNNSGSKTSRISHYNKHLLSLSARSSGNKKKFHLDYNAPVNLKKKILIKNNTHLKPIEQIRVRKNRRLNELVEVHNNFGHKKLSIIAAVHAKLQSTNYH